MTPDDINELQTRGLWPMDKEKPREWWLLDVVDHLGLKTLTAFRYTGETYGIHVIEYRAYDELKLENERLKNHFDNCHAGKIITLSLQNNKQAELLTHLEQALESVQRRTTVPYHEVEQALEKVKEFKNV